MESDIVDDVVVFVEKLVQQTNASPSSMYGLVKKHVAGFSADLDKLQEGRLEDTEDGESDAAEQSEKPPEPSHAQTAHATGSGVPEFTGNNLLDSLILKEILNPPVSMRKKDKGRDSENGGKR